MGVEIDCGCLCLGQIVASVWVRFSCHGCAKNVFKAVCRFCRISKLANVRLRILPKLPAKIDIVCQFQDCFGDCLWSAGDKPTFAMSDELNLCLVLPWCRIGHDGLGEVHWFRDT